MTALVLPKEFIRGYIEGTMKEEGNKQEKWTYEGKHSRYHCRVKRNKPSGTWSGYVRIPRGHPCYRMDYNEVDFKYSLDVHGGLTYGDDFFGRWEFGFDCFHGMDFAPTTEFGYQDRHIHAKQLDPVRERELLWNRERELLWDIYEPRMEPFGFSYKTKKFVIRETNNLARQFDEIEIKARKKRKRKNKKNG